MKQVLVSEAALESIKRMAEQDAKDAARYRWLRDKHWSDSVMCVVKHPMIAVKLGYECPSNDRLDEAIDAAMQEQK